MSLSFSESDACDKVFLVHFIPSGGNGGGPVLQRQNLPREAGAFYISLPPLAIGFFCGLYILLYGLQSNLACRCEKIKRWPEHSSPRVLPHHQWELLPKPPGCYRLQTIDDPRGRYRWPGGKEDRDMIPIRLLVDELHAQINRHLIHYLLEPVAEKPRQYPLPVFET